MAISWLISIPESLRMKLRQTQSWSLSHRKPVRLRLSLCIASSVWTISLDEQELHSLKLTDMSEQLFDELGAGLDEAVERGDLPNPGKKPEEVSQRNDTDSKSYIWALRSRLVELGYLGESAKNRSSSGIDQALTNAVKRFQRDVGEEQDRWAGPVTWRVLQCLLSFEDEQEPRHWKLKVPFQESPAVARAAWLRLWVMGFFVKNRNAVKDDWKNSKLKFNASM
ncbi:MAG TPA: peptidoglycan-binding protein, partial [Chlorobaculum parvum]|nr:peptidoglycan-binding protein [Chlorobaculum parvum]